MSRKHSLRRTVAGILAILTVTGNLIAPTQLRIPFAPDNALIAEAVDSSDVELNGKGYAFVDGTLFINGTISTTQSNYWDDTTRNIDLSSNATGISNLNKNNIQNVVIMGNAKLPTNSNRLFKNFTNLKTVVVEQGASFSGSSSTYTHLSSLFENCTNLESVDLSGLTNGNRVAYIDGMFLNCPKLVSADLSSITGEMMGTGTQTQSPYGLFVSPLDPVNNATDGDDKLAELTFSDSFVYNTVQNLANANSSSMHMSPEQLINDLLDGCNEDMKAALAQQLLDQYNDYAELQANGGQKFSISDLTITVDNKTYDGAPLSYSILKSNGQPLQPKNYEITFDGSSEVPVDAGTYTYTVVGKHNYTGEVSDTVTIDPVTLGLTWADKSFTYDGTEKCPTATLDTANVVEGETVTVSVAGGQVNAGDSYTATASLSDPNYALPEDQASCSFSIAKVDPDLGEVTAAQLACDEDIADIVLSRTNESVAGELAVTSAEISDEGTVDYLFTPTDTGNYNTVTGTVSVEKAEHTPGEAVEENRVEATCTEAGSYDLVVYCSECHEELSREPQGIPAAGHTEAEAVTENFNDSTCAAEGSYDSVVYCSVCGEELSRETVTIPKKDHTYGDLAWRWAEDYQSAELVSKCQNEGCEEENAYAADVVLDTADIRYIEANDVHGGVNVYKASVVVDGETYVDEQLVDTEKLSDVITAATRTLQLEGRIVVNWYAKYANGVTQPQMQIVDESGNVLRTVDGTYVLRGTYAGRYLFSYDVVAKEMSDETSVKFIGVRDGETVSTAMAYTYSVRAYCENKLNNEATPAALKDLCAALLTYGAAAQNYFGYRTDDLADINLDDLYGSDYTIDKSVIESSTAKGQRVAFDGATVAIKSPSLLLESGTTVRFYTDLTADNAEGAFLAYRAAETDAFTYAPIKCITSGNGTFYVGEIENIVAKDLTNLYEVYVCTAGEDGTYTQVSDTLFYGPEAYAVSQYNKSSNPETLKELVAAMMDYCAKAKAFFGSQNG